MEFIDVRVFFKKHGDARYISHLDFSRFMQRSLKQTGLPLWHTEGFNPHPYVTFALPLSVGMSGENETMDFRLTESVPFDDIKERLNSVMPRDIIIKNVASPFCKAKEIERAKYSVQLFECADLVERMNEFFKKSSILTQKKGKKGVFKEIDIAPYIFEHSINTKDQNVFLELTLPAGSEMNINPSLVIKALGTFVGTDFCPVRINRVAIFTKDGNLFE